MEELPIFREKLTLVICWVKGTKNSFHCWIFLCWCQSFLGWLMNYQEDTAWLIHSCQVIPACSAVIQTKQKNLSTKMHNIRCLKWRTWAIFDVRLLWLLVYCQLISSPQGMNHHRECILPGIQLIRHFEILHPKTDYSFLVWEPPQ